MVNDVANVIDVDEVRTHVMTGNKRNSKLFQVALM